MACFVSAEDFDLGGGEGAEVISNLVAADMGDRHEISPQVLTPAERRRTGRIINR